MHSSTRYIRPLLSDALQDNVEPLCLHIEETTLGHFNKAENFRDPNELVTQTAFLASIHAPGYTNVMEYPFKCKGFSFENYYDLVAIQKTDASGDKGQKKCQLFEFKNKQVKFLHVDGMSANCL